MDSTLFDTAPIISRPHPNAVRYDLSSATHTTITLPPGSKWSSGRHWHEHHTEYLRVAKGTVRVRLESQTLTISAPKPGEADAVVQIDRYARHEWHRADRDTAEASEGGDGEEVVVVESTEPADGEKTVFFYNVNGTILDAQRQSAEPRTGLSKRVFDVLLQVWITLRLFAVFAALDNYPSLIDLERRPWPAIPEALQRGLEASATHAVLAAATVFGHISGIRPVDQRYTPADLLRQWEERRQGSKKTR